MSERDDDREIAALFPLDASEGPAPWASSEALDRAVELALVRAGAPPLPKEPGAPADAPAIAKGAAGSGGSVLAVVGVAGVVLGALGMQWLGPATPHDHTHRETRTEVTRDVVSDDVVSDDAVSDDAVSGDVVSDDVVNDDVVNDDVVSDDGVSDDGVSDDVVSDGEAERRAARVRRAPTRTLEDWLATANTLRGERRWAEAEGAYLEAVRSAPSSRAAYVARLSAASLRLEHLHDARGALALYREAAQADGELDAQAELGVARAHRALGQRAAEREALERLLAQHPHSAVAAPAAARLAELEALTTEPTDDR